MLSADDTVIAWLLATDPSICWQVQRDLLDLPAKEYEKTRALIPIQGWGAKLLSYQDVDGQWGGGAFAPIDVPWAQWQTDGQPWTATAWSLSQLRELGLDPDSEIAKKTIKLVGENSKWEEGNQPFWQGETEECINGRTLADGLYYGVDMSSLAARLSSEIQRDGGWNCERCNGSKVSSFATTINVLEGFALVKGGNAEEIRSGAEEYLLQRSLFRKLSDGSIANEEFLKLLHPSRWKYDILRALDYFRMVNRRDERMTEAIEILRSKKNGNGKWVLERELRGKQWFKICEVNEPSPWITLKALRILQWWDEKETSG